MIEATAAYREAIIADARRIIPRAIIDVISPDIVYGAITSTGEESYSKKEQLYNKKFHQDEKRVTLERNRWLLNGAAVSYPDDPAALTDEEGFLGNVLSGPDGSFDTPFFVELQMSGVTVLQAASVYFTEADGDGVPADFTVDIKSGGTAYHTETFTGNTAPAVSLDRFTVNYPDAIRVTVTRWSLPNRRARMVEIVPGVYEEWSGDAFSGFEVKHQGDVTGTTLPYGTCALKIDNQSRRFEPRSKSGLFKSIEERQAIDVMLGVRLPDGKTDYKRLGMYYQSNGGWRTGDNGLTINWNLVDIIGLLVNRRFRLPDTTPTTLEGWVRAVMDHLGPNLAARYSIDAAYANKPVTLLLAADIEGKTCGDVLRYACQVTGTWARADAETGYLAVEPLWSQGNKVTLDNLTAYPVMRANKDAADVNIAIYGSGGQSDKLVISGTATAADTSVDLQNPFIHDRDQALSVARQILMNYGGNRLELTGRGDMTSEIGDVDTVWLNESTATTARRIMQTFTLSGGVLRNCKSTLLQADGAFLYENRAALTGTGYWTAPSNASEVRLILIGRGSDGERGTDGSWDAPGKKGADGPGGRCWAGTIQVNPGQRYLITVGDNTTFGTDATPALFSSYNGQIYPAGYTDIASGNAYARPGVAVPLPGTGDGGAGGPGGVQGRKHEEKIEPDPDAVAGLPDWMIIHTKTVIDNYPGPGGPGARGATGCAVIYWGKEATT